MATAKDRSPSAKIPADRRPMIGPEELAEYLGVPLNTLYDWRHKRLGPKASKVGKHVRYKWTDIDAWLEKQAQVAS